MATYIIENTLKGWIITKDGQELAGCYQHEQIALMALAFGLCDQLSTQAGDGVVTEDMLATAIANIDFSDTEL